MSGIPDFSDVELGRPSSDASADEWAKAFEATTGRSVEESAWET
ncbi:MAG: methylmalonyl-CoA mutase, partial [Blastococcus sp.]|nr:methylmalonyl-CoA mutase [Blastococcus sp.]